MNRAERPRYKCKEMPPWKLHIMLRGQQSRCSAFQRPQALNWVWWSSGRKQEIKGTDQKKYGEEEWGKWERVEQNPRQVPSAVWHRGSQRDKLAGDLWPSCPACVGIPDGDCLLPFWSAGWGGTCGYLEGFLIWKFTLSSSTFRLIEAAESLSTVDWKLLTDVRLLGLAESFSVGEGKDTGRGGE